MTAYHGLLVWGGSTVVHETIRASYFASRGGPVTRLQIRPTAEGLGGIGKIDLGPGRHGGTAAVYEHCASIDAGDFPFECDIYRYGFGTRHARPVPGASSRRYEERAPSVWGGRVLFARRLQKDILDEPIFSGPHLGFFVTAPITRLSRPKVEIDQTDLRGRTAAYVTHSLDFDVEKVFVKRFDRRGRGRSCRIARTVADSSASADDLAEPKLDGGYVYWARTSRHGPGDPPTSIHRRRLPGRDCRSRGPEQLASQTLPRGSVLSVDRGRIFYGTTTFPTDNSTRGDIWEMQPVSFIDR